MLPTLLKDPKSSSASLASSSVSRWTLLVFVDFLNSPWNEDERCNRGIRLLLPGFDLSDESSAILSVVGEIKINNKLFRILFNSFLSHYTEQRQRQTTRPTAVETMRDRFYTSVCVTKHQGKVTEISCRASIPSSSCRCHVYCHGYTDSWKNIWFGESSICLSVFYTKNIQF